MIKSKVKLNLGNFDKLNSVMKPEVYHIIIGNSDQSVVDEFKEFFKDGRYSIESYSSGKDLLDAVKLFQPEMILLDVDFDDIDGIEICWELRNNYSIFKSLIVFYSSRNEDFTQISAFDAGADDYIKYPVRPRLLKAKLDALLRRSFEIEEQINTFKKFGVIEIDEENLLVLKKGEIINLSKKEIQILILLTSSPGKVFKRNHILKKIWGDKVIVGERNMDTHIKKIRKKIGKEHIYTIRGIGYKFLP